jgi:hypothetical protein
MKAVTRGILSSSRYLVVIAVIPRGASVTARSLNRILAHLGTARHLGGLLLWPGVALHVAVALSLVWAWRGERRANVARTGPS